MKWFVQDLRIRARIWIQECQYSNLRLFPENPQPNLQPSRSEAFLPSSHQELPYSTWDKFGNEEAFLSKAICDQLYQRISVDIFGIVAFANLFI